MNSAERIIMQKKLERRLGHSLHNIKFWVYVNGNWCKIKLSPFQVLTHNVIEQDEYGKSITSRQWSYWKDKAFLLVREENTTKRSKFNHHVTYNFQAYQYSCPETSLNSIRCFEIYVPDWTPEEIFDCQYPKSFLDSTS